MFSTPCGKSPARGGRHEKWRRPEHKHIERRVLSPRGLGRHDPDSWNEWLSVKERLALEIKQIVESNKASFAFPSQSIYIEKK